MDKNRKVVKEAQDYAIEAASNRIANVLGLTSMPVIWNVNTYRVPDKGGAVRKYPMGFMYIQDISSVPHAAFKKQFNIQQFAALSNGTAVAYKLHPLLINLQFELITDDPNQAVKWASHLLIMREDHESNKELSFQLELTPSNMIIPSQLVLTTDSYPIERVEFSEDVPMEFKITGQIALYTRGTMGGVSGEVIARFNINDDVNPDAAILNQDGTTDGLFANADGSKKFPIRLRSNF